MCAFNCKISCPLPAQCVSTVSVFLNYAHAPTVVWTIVYVEGAYRPADTGRGWLDSQRPKRNLLAAGGNSSNQQSRVESQLSCPDEGCSILVSRTPLIGNGGCCSALWSECRKVDSFIPGPPDNLRFPHCENTNRDYITSVELLRRWGSYSGLQSVSVYLLRPTCFVCSDAAFFPI